MKTAVLPWFFQVIAVTFVYELKCPAPGHWRLRARKFYCGQSYVCLLRSPENSYRETCDGLDYSSTGLSQWPDAFYKVPSFKWIVDHLMFIDMLKEGESKKIKKQSSNEEKNRTLMEILLNGDEDHYNQFLEALNAFKEYQELAMLIQNTEVTSEDRELVHNCTKRIN